MTDRGIHHPYFALPAPWLIAHRGGSLEAPENTLVAFDRAAALGADVIETDVRLSRDGQVMVFHDEDTRRITGLPGTIEERTRAELDALDAGWSYTEKGEHPWRGKGVRIPTLAEALARYPGLRFNVEAKGDEERLAEALRDVLDAAHAQDRVCVGASHRAQAQRLARLLPGYARFLPTLTALPHFLAAFGLFPSGWASDDYDLAALPIRQWGIGVVSKRLVRYFHDRGMVVQVWTVDEEPDMRALLAKGVDGIMSDAPTLLKSVLGR